MRFRSIHLYGLSLASVLLCLALWPPMIWMLGDTLRRDEERRRRWPLRCR